MPITRTPEIKYTQLFINNEWVSSSKKMPSVNPSTGDKIIDVDVATKEHVDAAVAAAKAAFAPGSPWRQMDASQRGVLLYKLADAIEAQKEYLASLETIDNGKPVKDSLLDLTDTINTFRYYAGWADKIHGKTIPADGKGIVSMTRIEPVGVCGQIIPWNYPCLMAAWKWAPALTAGNTVVLKPSEKTPLTALVLAQLAKEVGFPPGVINVINGDGPSVGQLLVSHPDIDKVAFTGSTVVGKKIQSLAGESSAKRVSLEMGGKSPVIVMPDADLDLAAEIAHEGCMVNMGQCCVAATRTFVHEKVYEEFVTKAKKLAVERKVGDPFDESTIQGPQVDDIQFNKILSLIETGKKEGATLVCGGNNIKDRKGYFVEPTVFSNVTDDMRIAKEEIFGPVQQILKFKTLDEAIKRANETQYGLGAGIITKNLDDALTFAQGVRAGSIFVNCYDYVTPQTPFGGFKMSGHGRELGEDGLKEYCEVKTITIQLQGK